MAIEEEYRKSLWENARRKKATQNVKYIMNTTFEYFNMNTTIWIYSHTEKQTKKKEPY